MNHPELDELLDLARDDAAADEIRRHLDECADCAGDLAAMIRLDAAADLIGPDPDACVAPASSVWDEIQAELSPADPVVATRSQAPRRRGLMVAAAAAVSGVVVGGIGGYLWSDSSSSPDRAAPQSRGPFAVATLLPAGQGAVSGEVAMTRGDASRSLAVTFDETVAGPGYLEAWLLDPETNEMLGLGVVGPDGGTVTVPQDADLTRFTAVDISREPFDGDPAHSADSLARGTLRQL